MLIRERFIVERSALLIALTGMAVFCYLMPGHPNLKASAPPVTGIEGTVSVGPIQGGPSKQGVPDSAPLAGMSFVVENAGRTVANFTTDDEGRFRVPLPPGHYIVRSANMKTKNAKCQFEADVDVTGFKKVHYRCDTGMR